MSNNSHAFSVEDVQVLNGFNIHIDTDREDKQLSLYHVGISLTLIQRLINIILEEPDDDPESPLAFLSANQRVQAAQLKVTKVQPGSIDIHTVFDVGFLGTVLWNIGKGALSKIGERLSDRFFNPIDMLNESKNPYKPNDRSRRNLEALAQNVKRGGLIFSFRLGNAYCFIDRTTQAQIEKFKMSAHGKATSYTGLVVGSKMRQQYISVEIDQFRPAKSDIPCTFSKKQLNLFRPYSKYNTRVEVTGTPFWEGVDKPVGLPTYIKLLSVKESFK